MKTCEKCQAPIADDSAFCTNCGAKQNIPSSPVADFKTPNPPAPNTPSPSAFSSQFEMANSTPAPTPVSNPNPAMPQPPIQGQNMPSSETNSNKKLLIIISAVAAVIIIVLIVVIIVLLGNQPKSQSNSNQITPNQSSSDTQQASTTSTTSGNATLGPYSLTIPDNYQYESTVSQGYELIALTDDPATWMAAIAYEDNVYFSNIQANMDLLADVCLDYGEVKVGSTDFVYCDDKTLGNQGTRWWSRAGSYTFETITVVKTGNDSHELMDKVEPIIASATRRNIARGITNNDDTENLSEFYSMLVPMNKKNNEGQ